MSFERVNFQDPIKIVLTGGPCAGKTSAMANIERHLINRGFHPFFVPEAATQIIAEHKLHPSLFSGKDGIIFFQELVMLRQLHNEETVSSGIARANLQGRPVMILDRGVMDSLAYFRRAGLPDSEFERMLERLSAGDLMHNLKDRYSMTLFLDTAPREIYERGMKNNPARQEDYDSAWRTNELLKGAWAGSNLKIVTNPQSGVFEDKVRQALMYIDNELGEPPVEYERKFSVMQNVAFPSNIEVRQFKIEQYYLKNDSKDVSSERVRSITLMPQEITYYYHTVKHKKSGFGTYEKEEKINEEKFSRLLSAREHLGRVIKNRFCFTSGAHHFELDVFEEPAAVAGRAILEVEGGEDLQNTQISFPAFLQIGEELTEKVSNKRIAQGKYGPLRYTPKITIKNAGA